MKSKLTFFCFYLIANLVMGQEKRMELGVGTVALNNRLLQFAGIGDTQHYSGYTYNAVDFYVVAHQDDWQLFMGYQAWYDIQTYKPGAPSPNGAKVVIICVTDGTFCNDSGDYNNVDPHFSDYCSAGVGKYYSGVREEASMKSVYIATGAAHETRAEAPYAPEATLDINGHQVAMYRYKNTVSYFLRIRTYCIDQWSGLFPHLPQNLNAPGYCSDSNVYAGNADLVQTIAAIYDYETNKKGDVVPGAHPWVNIQDPNVQNYNICDHPEHTWSGTVAYMADQVFAGSLPGSPILPVNLWEDYVIAGGCADAMPINISTADIGYKTALMTAYEMTLLQDKSYIEWDEWPQYLSRTYNRLTNTALGW